jgi:hypothetical protein
MNKRKCAYCGVPVTYRERDHVFPSCLYPPSRSNSRVQRLVVPVCSPCNRGWSVDEDHFRDVLLMSGEPNEAVRELWERKVLQSFRKDGGRRRVRDLLEQMHRVETSAGERWAIYPGRDERVMRIVRKVIRGLCHYHGVMSPVSDERVWADVLKYVVPQEFLDQMEHHHREQDIARYRYQVLSEPPIHSVWLITFYERRTFIGMVSTLENGFPENGWA